MRRKLKRFVRQGFESTIHRLATRNIDDCERRDADLRLDFIARCRAMAAPSVLELGTKRSNPAASTRHDDWVPHAREYLGTDLAEGLDVDLVADLHRLTKVTGEERFDAIVSCSTFEHLKYPHLAAHELMKALRIGGLLYIQTHQSFPLHAYPYDYFRFSREGLEGLFGSNMGFRVLASDYEFPVRLYSPRDQLWTNRPAFLNVRLYGEKTGTTPVVYEYEFDVT